MSPEQAAGLDLSEASDWYSLGVILYQCLTGNAPFRGTYLEIMQEKQQREPLPPSHVVGNVPSDLNDLCSQLLRRDPHERPAGFEVLERLGKGTRRAQPQRGSPIDYGVPDGTFVGRSRHLAELDDAMRTSCTGCGVTVYVHSHSGMGKTTLVQRFLTQAKANYGNVLILAGRCYERESIPYKAFDEVVDSLSRYLQRLPDAEVNDVIPQHLDGLLRLFPVLGNIELAAEKRGGTRQHADSQEIRRRAVAELREIFALLANKTHVVVFVDDLQWGDTDSAVLLSELMRPPDPPAILFIGAFRTDEASTSPMLRRLLPVENARSQAPLRVLEVGPLEAQEACELAKSFLLQERSETLEERAEAIARESRGVPFFLSELAQYGGEDSSRRTLEDVIHARYGRLNVEGRRLLETVAVAEGPLSASVARQAAMLDPQDDSVTALRVARLIRIRAGGEEIETYHDRIRETIVARLAPERQKDLHRVIAETLEQVKSDDVEALSFHYLAAGSTQKAAIYSAAAASEAAAALAFDRAVRLYQRTVDLETRATERHKAQVGLAESLAHAGRAAESARAYVRAATSTTSTASTELRRRAAEQFLRAGLIDDGIQMFYEVTRAVGLRWPKTALGLIASLLARRLWLRLRGLGFRERSEAEVPADQLMRIDTCWTIHIGSYMFDAMRAVDWQARGLLWALRAGELRRIAKMLISEMVISNVLGPNRRFSQLENRITHLLQPMDDPYVIGWMTSCRGIARWFRGEWKECVELVNRGERILLDQSAGADWEILTARCFALHASYWMGDFHELRERVPAILDNARQRGDFYAEAMMVTRFLHLVRLAADEPGEILSEVRTVLGRWSQRGFHLQHMYEAIVQVDVGLYTEATVETWNYLNGKWRTIKGCFHMRVQALRIEYLLLHARAALAAAAATAEPAAQRHALLKSAERDARQIEREKTPCANALSLLVRALVREARGDAKEAIGLLESAEAQLDALDMGFPAAVCRRRRGELVGTKDGDRLVEEADNWMHEHGIKNPSRMAAIFAPNPWIDGSGKEQAAC
jgi:hypothetical protein